MYSGFVGFPIAVLQNLGVSTNNTFGSGNLVHCCFIKAYRK